MSLLRLKKGEKIDKLLKNGYSSISLGYIGIYDRIISSDAWDALMENEYYYNIHRGLLNGFPGTVLALLNIKQRYLCE